MYWWWRKRAFRGRCEFSFGFEAKCDRYGDFARVGFFNFWTWRFYSDLSVNLGGEFRVKVFGAGAAIYLRMGVKKKPKNGRIGE